MTNPFAHEIDSWISSLIFSLPGKLGQSARVFWCRQALALWGTGSRVANGVQFSGRRTIRIGGRCQIGANSLFAADGGSIRVGNNVQFNRGVHINASVGGNIVIGDNCLIGPNVVMRSATHRIDDLSKNINQQGHDCGDIIIEDDVWIAANVVVLPGVILGRGSVVGAGSVVSRSTSPMSVNAGVPAREQRKRGSKR